MRACNGALCNLKFTTRKVTIEMRCALSTSSVQFTFSRSDSIILVEYNTNKFQVRIEFVRCFTFLCHLLLKVVVCLFLRCDLCYFWRGGFHSKMRRINWTLDFWKQASTKRIQETGTIALFSDGIKRIKMRRGGGRSSSVADLRPNIFLVDVLL